MKDPDTLVNLFRLPFRETRTFASEEVLVRAARKGDRQAFDTLVQEFQYDLRRFLAKRVPEGDLEDVLQETWLAAWSALPKFDRRSRFKTWLYALSLNKCRDHHRQARRTEPTREGLADEAIDARDVEGETATRQTAAALLDSLTPTQREVLELYYFAELTLPEIARVLSRNLNTVKYQFYRGHSQAGEFLRAQGLAPAARSEEEAACK